MSIDPFGRCDLGGLSTKGGPGSVSRTEFPLDVRGIRVPSVGWMDWVRIVAGVLLAVGIVGFASYAPHAMRALLLLAHARQQRQRLLHYLNRLEAKRKSK